MICVMKYIGGAPPAAPLPHMPAANHLQRERFRHRIAIRFRNLVPPFHTVFPSTASNLSLPTDLRVVDALPRKYSFCPRFRKNARLAAFAQAQRDVGSLRHHDGRAARRSGRQLPHKRQVGKLQSRSDATVRYM